MALADTSLITGGLIVVVLLVTLYSSVSVVREGEIEALFTFGEMEAVLYPGLNFVPPFVSNTYPIDTEGMVVKTDDGAVSVPQEFRQEIRKSDLTD